MTRPYSMDLRVRVVAAVAAGRSCREAAAAFGVSVATVVRWGQRARATGSPAPKPVGGRRRWTLLPVRDWLLARIATAPDVTVRGLVAELAERGQPASYGAVWAFLAEEGLSFKKTLHAAEQDRPDVARKRERWKAHQHRIDPARQRDPRRWWRHFDRRIARQIGRPRDTTVNGQDQALVGAALHVFPWSRVLFSTRRFRPRAPSAMISS